MTIDISKAIKDGGSFDIIRRRLLNAADELQKKTDTVNEVRNSTFGGGELSLSGNINLLTSNNCTPVDMARVGENLLFGFSTKLGIKSHLEAEDLFSVYCLKSEQTQPEMIPLKETFIYNKEFLNDLNNLLTYNKAAKLKQLYRKSDELFIVFSISDVSADYQHFRFSLANPDSPKYLGYSSGRPSAERHSMNWSRLLDGDIIGATTPLYSVANEIFIGMATNELTFKVDDNSSNGLSILNENVENKFQRTQDLVVHQCKEGNLIFLKVKLLDEKSERFYVFNTITQNIVRADGIKNGVQSLPEDHGVIFSNGYALSSGEVKTFSGEPVSLEFHKAMYSPNGEDCLFFYADIVSSEYTIYHYNMINKAVAPPMHACGYALKQSGELYMFRSSQNSQPEKLHKLQVWQTPFMTQEAYSLIDKSSENSSVIKNIGNAALVRGISDIKSILKLIRDEDVSSSLYEGIIKSVTKAIDTHHWFSDAELHSLNTDLASIKTTSELVLEEFNKTSELARSAKSKAKSLADECQDLIHNVNVLRGDDTTRYLTLLQESKLLLGKLIEAKSIRFIDAEEIDELQSNISSQKAKVVDSLVSLLQRKSAFKGFHDAIASIQDAIQSASKSSEVNPQLTKITELTDALTSLNDEVSEIEVEDSTKITFIIEQLSQCFTSINTLRSSANSKLKDFARIEAEKEFAVQIKQLDQMIEVAMNRANTPTECDNELAKLTAQFEKLEGRFADFDDYIGKVITKRNDTYSNIETRKTQLVSEIQRRISNIKKSASISLKNIQQRASRLETIAELHALFTSDSMVSKIREYSEQIEALGDAVVASSLIGELNAIREQSARDIRDKQDLFEDNGRLVVLGKHRFSVNKKEVSLNIISRDGKPHAAISSTDFSQPIENSELNGLVEYFDFDVPSENAKTYRGEYLAFQLLNEVSSGNGIVNHDTIKEHLKKKSLGLSSELENLISEHISKSYKEGYIRGVHDIDGLKILEAVYPLYFSDNGSSKVSQQSRIDAMNLFNVLKSNGELSEIHKNLTSMKEAANTLSAPSVFTEALRQYSIKYQTSNDVIECLMDSTHLEDNALTCHFKISHEAHDLLNEVKERGINLEVFTCNDETKAVFKQVALQVNNKLSDGYIEEAYAAITADSSSSIGSSSIYEVQGLVGDHPVINKGVIKSDVESFVARCQYIQNTHSTQFDKFVETRQSLANEWEQKLQLSEFEAKPLSNFVRNKLIKDCYLPMIGDSLAQQMGSAGSTTSAQNGGLLLLSPPGYGKTTLLEYVAKIMGVVFVKINCPTIGHEVTGIVPEEAESAAARKELVKLNMALEMGNNVLLYLDDIQHLHTEFLQKFISLCDGTRKIEGSWEGVAKTYDMKGKRFAIAMAGNPYTENGEAFKVPDMLVNRMSSYNLGDIMTGMEEAFELSYIENALTSNKVTAPLASRSQDDLYKLIRMAKGEEIGIAELEHNYSPAEASEIIEILKQMLAIQDVILKVNAEYIRSAAMNHRKEPQFLLQGSYRNMSKMVEKLVPAMNENDIEALIFDHYRAESQTLTTGAEENILRFKQLIGKMTAEDKVRWSEITKSYAESAVNLSDTPVEERTLKAILSIAEAIKSDK